MQDTRGIEVSLPHPLSLSLSLSLTVALTVDGIVIQVCLLVPVAICLVMLIMWF